MSPLLEGKAANTHLTHLEELILTQGPQGYQGPPASGADAVISRKLTQDVFVTEDNGGTLPFGQDDCDISFNIFSVQSLSGELHNDLNIEYSDGWDHFDESFFDISSINKNG